MNEIRGGFVSYTRPVTLDQKFAECFSLYVGAAGNIAVRYGDNSTDTLVGVVAGTFYPLRVIEVLSVGTTVAAANLRRAY